MAEEAYEAVDDTLHAMEKILEQEDGFHTAEAALEAITDDGIIIISSAQSMLKEVENDFVDLRADLSNGLYAESAENMREAVRDMQQSAKLMSEWKQLAVMNENRLIALSSDTAKVAAYRDSMALPAWENLSDHPESNWHDVRGNLAEANEILDNLFDDPSDSDDLYSRIERENSLEMQDFDSADDMLDSAFADLHRAKELLEDLIHQNEIVEQIRSEIANTIAGARLAIKNADARRDANNDWIDAKVDQMITQAEGLVNQAQQEAESYEFTVAQKSASAAHRMATQAYASADAQSDHIEGLYQRLEGLRESAAALVSQALRDYSYMTPAAQNASTGGWVNEAQSDLKKAKKMSTSFTGEDRKLAKQLEKAVDHFETAKSKAQKALQKIADDKRKYANHISNVSQAIGSAQSEISSASNYVRDSDAHGAGRSSLDRARSMIPNSPKDGDTYQNLKRKLSAADDAASAAQSAKSEAKRKIRSVEAAREAEARRRREAEEKRRREERRREQEREDKRAADRRAAARRASSSSNSSRSSSSSYSSRSSSRSSSGRSSSSSRSSRSSSSSRGGRH